jgi:nickel-dependent lactate racemase
MTHNQLILLLEIHSGRDTAAKREDFDYLIKKQLITKAFITDENKVINCPEGDVCQATQKGNQLIQELLNFCSGK